MFAEAGYDAYQSIQRTAGMDLMKIKEQYGKTMVPWGGLDVESLVSGTPPDIRREVTFAMNNYKPVGRYIFGTSHSVAVGTKYDNFMTMVEEFEKQRSY
jgi:uroporphyrinogen-III decarboxylase